MGPARPRGQRCGEDRRTNCIRSNPTMEVTRKTLVDLLSKHGGKMKKSDFVSEFRSLLESDDQAERRRRRDNFKALVNQVACVKDQDGIRHVVLKRVHQALLDSRTAEDEENKEVEDGDVGSAGKLRRTMKTLFLKVDSIHILLKYSLRQCFFFWRIFASYFVLKVVIHAIFFLFCLFF